MTCPPHHRIVTGLGYAMVGVCRKCGDVQRYAFTIDDTTWERSRYRRDKTTPPVSAMGGTV